MTQSQTCSRLPAAGEWFVRESRRTVRTALSRGTAKPNADNANGPPA